MSARVFIHPKYHEGPAVGALTVGLEAAGLDCTNLGIGPPDSRRRKELVRTIETTPLGGRILERMDGSRFTHYAGWPAPEYA